MDGLIVANLGVSASTTLYRIVNEKRYSIGGRAEPILFSNFQNVLGSNVGADDPDCIHCIPMISNGISILAIKLGGLIGAYSLVGTQIYYWQRFDFDGGCVEKNTSNGIGNCDSDGGISR